jgi:hypothetical protein
VRRRRFTLAALAGALTVLAAAPAARADTTQSSNWAGYAVHRKHVSFEKVTGSWRQPTAVCAAANAVPSYSSEWVGLGGYALNAPALEQIGSEVDCSPTGRVVSSAWYELVPAPSRSVRMRVDPGDLLSASVLVKGHATTLTLRDLTRHTTFSRRVHVKPVDVSSAEWIIEAPSECSSASSCQTLNLADFGTAGFTAARATSATGHTGSISDHHWGLTKITLAAGQRHFIGGAPSGARAQPSALTAGGSAFSVTYQGAASSAAPTQRTRQGRVSAVGRLRPGGARHRG